MAEEKNMPERRYPRIKKVNLVQVSRIDEEGFRADLATGRTLNMSRGGVRIELHHPLPLRSVVGLNMALGEQILEVSGTVVYLEVLDEDRCAMGIEFKELSAEAAKVIGEYLEGGGGLP